MPNLRVKTTMVHHDEEAGYPKEALLPRTTKDEAKGGPVSHQEGPLRLHPAFYVAAWMTLSSVVILFNKWILDRAKYPILLTCYHLTFATITTQILALTTSLLDRRHVVRMSLGLYMRAIVPIGVLYSLSLVCSNLPYLYLSVAFIQMLKGTAPIFVFIALCSLRLSSPTVRTSVNLLVIVFGVVLASFGEVRFHLTGFLFQFGGLVFEAYRLALIQKLLNDERCKMDPMVSLYYFAPCCAAMIAVMGMVGEWTTIRWEDVAGVGWKFWIANGAVAMALNAASVLLIGKTSSLVLTLCGVLKSITLIGASMVIWGAVVTPIQFLGNGIAMAGLVYYNLGGEKMHELTENTTSWGTHFWQQRSRGWKLMLAIGLAISCLGIIGGLAVGYDVTINLEGLWRMGAVN